MAEGAQPGPFRGPAAFAHCRHGGQVGHFNEQARRVSHEELDVAMLLASEGHFVRALPEQNGRRSADLMACGVSVEVKSFQSAAVRQGRPPTAAGVANKLMDARGQGSVTVIWGKSGGLSAQVAEQGYERFCQEAQRHGLGRTRQVRMVGAGFDVTKSPVVDVVKVAQAQASGQVARAARSPVLGR